MKKIWQATLVSPYRFAAENKKKKKIMAIAKLSALYANAKRQKGNQWRIAILFGHFYLPIPKLILEMSFSLL